MELTSHQQAPIPLPLNTRFGHSHDHDHGGHHETTAPPRNHIITAPSNQMEDPFKKVTVKYKECLKNHAASMGGTATDGCGEFMPSGEDGSLEALNCSACNCHRNFHRKEIQGDTEWLHARVGRKQLMIAPEAAAFTGAFIPSRNPHAQHMIMSYLHSESDEQEEGNMMVAAKPSSVMKKRFRTKFTPEQKEKMLQFAEKVGWKIQKQEESVVQQFCQEIGVKRRVLKVWMHNNKHNLAKKITSPTPLN